MGWGFFFFLSTDHIFMKCKKKKRCRIYILSKYCWPNQTCPDQHANCLRSYFHVVSLQWRSPWLSARASGTTARSTTFAPLWITRRSKATVAPCSTTSGPCPTSSSPPPACSPTVCSVKHSPSPVRSVKHSPFP